MQLYAVWKQTLVTVNVIGGNQIINVLGSGQYTPGQVISVTGYKIGVGEGSISINITVPEQDCTVVLETLYEEGKYYTNDGGETNGGTSGTNYINMSYACPSSGYYLVKMSGMKNTQSDTYVSFGENIIATGQDAELSSNYCYANTGTTISIGWRGAATTYGISGTLYMSVIGASISY